MESSEDERVLNSAMRSLSMRPHAASELRRKLLIKGMDARAVDRVIERLKEIDLLNDEKFAHDYLEYGFLRKSWGTRKVRAGLMGKGVDREIVNELLAGPEATEMERQGARRFIEKEKRGGQITEEAKKKIVSRLMARGFGWDTASEMIKEL